MLFLALYCALILACTDVYLTLPAMALQYEIRPIFLERMLNLDREIDIDV